ncbi:hypothetical protein LEP1GSC077_2644 [Leptospira interrogans str. C10069]|nr:hypothetical protein LEP1GSC077_2644 [Leptospira interrogans str. C10069]
MKLSKTALYGSRFRLRAILVMKFANDLPQFFLTSNFTLK